MRKILTLLIVLAIAAPGVGVVCNCFPVFAGEIPSAPVLSASECGSCAGSLEVSKDPFLDRSNQESFFISSWLRFFTLSFITTTSATEPSRASAYFDSSPPENSSRIPLYLSLESLRL